MRVEADTTMDVVVVVVKRLIDVPVVVFERSIDVAVVVVKRYKSGGSGVKIRDV
jgi:hypothetical protein